MLPVIHVLLLLLLLPRDDVSVADVIFGTTASERVLQFARPLL